MTETAQSRGKELMYRSQTELKDCFRKSLHAGGASICFKISQSHTESVDKLGIPVAY